MKLAHRLACILALTLPLAASSQTATLLGDFNTAFDDSIFGLPSSSPESFAVLTDRIVFSAHERGTGRELWVSDGTAGGTRILEDICRGSCSSNPRPLGLIGGVSLWLVQLAEHGPWQLWRSDGTEAGTSALDLFPFGFSEHAPFVLLDGALHFGYCTEGQGCDLWRTDGTEPGTRIVKALSPSSLSFGELTAAGKRLYFLAGDALWITDGTAAGTKPVAGFNHLINPALTAGTSDGKLFFATYDDEGRDLWVTDGTSTRRLTRFEAPDPFQNTQWIKPIGNRVYFVINDVIHGHEIWRSDGTEKGTRQVTDFGFYTPFGNGTDLAPEELHEVSGRVIFRATDGLGPYRIWASAGTPASPIPLADVTLDCTFPGSPFFQANGRVFFVARDDSHGCEVWSTDGTAAGTRITQDVCAQNQSFGCNGEEPLLVGTLEDSLILFLAHDGDAHGSEVWASDGFGAERVTDMPGSARPSARFALAGLRLYFSGTDGHGEELWLFEDGETRLVTDISRQEPGSRPRDFLPFGDRLVFTACDGLNRQFRISSGTSESTAVLPITGPASCSSSHFDEFAPNPVEAAGRMVFTYQDHLWATDGTAAGTVQLIHLPSGFFDSRAALLGTVYFDVPNPDLLEIWRSDGTPQGTVKAFEVPDAGWTDGIAALGNELYFTGSKGDGIDLWRSDGTQAGTRRLTQGRRVDLEVPLVRVGSSVFFVVAPGFMAGLWKTDGTAAGTVRVINRRGIELTEHQGNLYFFADGEDGKWNLWRSDGTTQGTEPVRSFEYHPPDFNTPATDLTALGGHLYFAADDGAHGVELWRSDGTAAGTAMVADLLPGQGSSKPSSLTAAGGKLWFAADDGERGNELWTSDGTAAGTRLAHDLAPEDLSSYPGQLTATPTHLYFVADDGVAGRELWSLPLAGGGCQLSLRHLCLGGFRYRVEAAWKDFQGNVGKGTAVMLTADTGYFWFFRPDNAEVMVKVLDGTELNGHRWVFYGALSSVEYTITVTDTQTGLTRRYFNPPGQLASVGDTTSFGPLGAFSRTPKITEPSPAVPVEERTVAATGSCLPTSERLCLGDLRFSVEVAWKDFQGNQGTGKAFGLTPETGYFWFFDAANVELMIKVLDGTSLNGKYWVFYGALSSVEYTITVTDTETGAQRIYRNVPGRLASVADTGAF